VYIFGSNKNSDLTAPAAQSKYSANTQLFSTSSTRDRRINSVPARINNSLWAPLNGLDNFGGPETKFRRHWS